MALQLTELTEQLVTIRDNLDPKHGVIPDLNELMATSLALSQLIEDACAFVDTQIDRFRRVFFLPIRTEIEELLVEITSYLSRVYSHGLSASPPPPEGHVMKLGVLNDVSLEINEKLTELNSRMTECETLCAEFDRFWTEFRGAWEQLKHQVDQRCNEV